jgi:hypothetical protein
MALTRELAPPTGRCGHDGQPGRAFLGSYAWLSLRFGRPSQFPVYVMMVLVCAVILMIQDIGLPEQ